MRFLVVLFLLLLTASAAQAQFDTVSPGRVRIGESRGKDFWLCFPQNARFEIGLINLRLYITGDRNTRGVVTIPGLNFRKEFVVPAQQIIQVDLDSAVQITLSERVMDLGVHVEAENPIAVFGLSNRKASTDSYLALPTDVLGTTYRAMGYHAPTADPTFATQFNIVATEDNTSVMITLTGDTKGGRKAGETFAIQLNKGQVYGVQGGYAPNRRGDLTGSLVNSNKPIGFFVGHACAQVPAEFNFCDQLLEMSPPIP
ncbi:MAG TPA: IgGFc-binding protein, partial [Candidatus Kapabacteria bacterium]|nr:IgGFc-binding protein [Candidatus Kapabacteria bacterium]